MKALEVPIGSGFLGTVDNDDWKQHFKPGKPLCGEIVNVTCVVPTASYNDTYLKELMHLHARHLHSYSSSQINFMGCMWVAGVRESRSKKVRVFDWVPRLHKTYLEQLHEMLTKDDVSGARDLLQRLAQRDLPFV